jgi:hypothetical protein
VYIFHEFAEKKKKISSVLGSRLTSLELTNIDELNLNAIVMIGAGCHRLERLKISYCHYTVEANDRRRLEAAAEAARTETAATSPFRQLRYATFLLSSSTHLALLKYPLLFARQLQELTISQMYHPLEDSFVAALLTWNPMVHLQKFQLNKGEKKHVWR